MPTASIVGKRLVLYYKKGSFSFGKVDLAADNESLYDLAGVLNSFQDEKPPTKVVLVSTELIV